jgi:hypothetical protein
MQKTGMAGTSPNETSRFTNMLLEEEMVGARPAVAVITATEHMKQTFLSNCTLASAFRVAGQCIT